jgi:RNA polymerase sigma-70 factor (ECF subfamily)
VDRLESGKPPALVAANNQEPSVTADSATVFAAFQKQLRAFVSRRVRNSADAEDVVQETFVHIHRRLGQVRSPDRLTAWVFQVARNAIVDHYRRQRNVADAVDADHDPVMSATMRVGEPGSGELEQLAACLTPMIERLPAPDREAIRLSEIDGLTQRDASSRAGVSHSGMKSRVQRARRKLKTMLLECCRIELDRRGGIVGHEPRAEACEPCRSPDGAFGAEQSSSVREARRWLPLRC